jgi:hypothetical protein
MNLAAREPAAVIEGSSHILLTDAFRHAAQADIAAIRGFRYGTVVRPGPITLEDLYQWTSSADAAGLHAIVHAIGDRAIRTQLDIYERVAREHGPRDRRFRIEHAQHLSPNAIARFAELGVLPSMQPYHAIDDGRWAEKRIGPERAKTTYAFRSLLDAKAGLMFGSDWTVAPIDPLLGIYAAVTRRTLDGRNPNGWVPEQVCAGSRQFRWHGPQNKKKFGFTAALQEEYETIPATVSAAKIYPPASDPHDDR